MKKSQIKRNTSLSRRMHFPEEEKRLTWLPFLLDAYAVADTGVAIAVREQGKKGKRKLACEKGCGACCVHQRDLPLYPHELVGIYWYVTEKMPSPARDILKRRLAARREDPACPFLVDNACSIHPLRPVGCRQFNVFSIACSSGEDPYYTRRDDVLEPLPEYLDRAFAAVLPFYRLDGNAEVAAGVRVVRRQVMNLRDYDWNKLAAAMDKSGASGPG